MSNSLDPDQARRIVGPDLGPNCLPKVSADDTGRQRVKQYSPQDMRKFAFLTSKKKQNPRRRSFGW